MSTETPDVTPEWVTPEALATTYDIPQWAVEEAAAKIAAANKRAARAGIAAQFTYTVETYTRVKPRAGGEVEAFAAPVEYETRATITLNRPAIAHEGYTFVAALTWDAEAGLVTRVVPGATLAARPEDRACDVCHTVRDRKDTYVVQGPDGTQTQVGSNCLETFMGIRPGNLWMFDFGLDAFADDDREGGYGGGERRFDVVEVLAYAAAVVADSGWVSRAAAEDQGKTATVDLVREAMFGNPKRYEDIVWQREIKASAAGRTDEAQGIRDLAVAMTGDSEYVANLTAVAAAETVTDKNMALLVSACAVVARQREQAARAALMVDSVHIGAVKDKIKDLPATVIGVRYLDGHYGVTTLLTFLTPDGNVIKWFASGSHNWEVGDEVTVSGTIKGHGEYQGVAETQITRAKVAERAAE